MAGETGSRVRRGRRAAAVGVMVLLPVLSAARCTSSELETLAEEGGTLARNYSSEGRVLHPGSRPPVVLRGFDPTTAEQEVSRLAGSPALVGLDDEDALAVAGGACTADDLLDLAEASSPDDAARKVIAMGRGPAAYRAKIADLVGDLQEADSSLSQAVVAGKAAFCEAVDQQEQ